MHRTENSRLYLIKSANANCSDGNSGTSSCDDTAISDEPTASAKHHGAYLNLSDYSRLSKANTSNLDTIHLNNQLNSQLNSQLNGQLNSQLTGQRSSQTSSIRDDSLISMKGRHLYNSVGNLASTDQFINPQSAGEPNGDTFTCRVQYLNDLDAFSLTTLFPEPSRPPLFPFNVNIPLINQLPSVHRLLNAPHRVSELWASQIERRRFFFKLFSSAFLRLHPLALFAI